MTRARVLVADPPWQFGDRLGKRGAAANYPTMPVAEICNFPLPPLAKDAYLFLWRVAAMQDEALAVARAWGFTVKTDIAWMKTRTCARCEGRGWTPLNDGITIKVDGKATGLWCVACEGKGYKIAFGLGHHTRSCKEICILATRGQVKPISRSVRDIFHAPLERDERRALNRGGIYWPTRKARAFLSRSRFAIVRDHSAACTCGVCFMARRRQAGER